MHNEIQIIKHSQEVQRIEFIKLRSRRDFLEIKKHPFNPHKAVLNNNHLPMTGNQKNQNSNQ
jgi:hypothetical protein